MYVRSFWKDQFTGIIEGHEFPQKMPKEKEHLFRISEMGEIVLKPLFHNFAACFSPKCTKLLPGYFQATFMASQLSFDA